MLALAKKVEYGLGYLARFCYALAALALAAIVAIIVASVVMRRVAGSPLYYTEELVGLLLGASRFLALPKVTMEGSLVRQSADMQPTKNDDDTTSTQRTSQNIRLINPSCE